VNGWLLDTNVIAELAKPHGTARVQAWASAQDEALPFLSILTLGEYDNAATPSHRHRLRRSHAMPRSTWRVERPDGSQDQTSLLQGAWPGHRRRTGRARHGSISE
jgi:predicted nucleic acid-binding protein